MARANDLTGILTTLMSAGDGDFGYRQGFVKAWNPVDGENEIVVAGASVFNMPVLVRTEALALQVGDVVGILRVKSQYFMIGRISVNAGEIVVRDTNGDIAIRLGRGPTGDPTLALYHPGTDHAVLFVGHTTFAGEDVGRGIVVEQADGIDVLVINPELPGGKPTVRVHDVNGVRAVSTDLGPDGMLERPFIPVPMYGNNSTGSYALASGQPETTIWIGQLYATHAYVHARVLARVGASTTGEFKLKLAGVQLGSTLTTSSTSDVFLDFGAQLHGLPAYTFELLSITARVTAGANSAIVRPYGVFMRGTP